MRDPIPDVADGEVSRNAAAHTSATPTSAKRIADVRPGLFARVIDRFEPARTVLLVSVVVWCVWFFRLPQLRHERFQTFGFDLGIYDQGVWLLSQLRDPFVTVRGIDLFGHHMNVFLLAIAPLYRLGGGVEVLLAVQVLAQASGAIAVFLLGRDVLKSRSVWCRARDRVAVEPDVSVAHVGVLPP